MHLKSFTVKRYRSISDAKKICLGRNTVLVGPNNEGKSNFLRALVTAMQLLKDESNRIRFLPDGRKLILRTLRRHDSRTYDWQRDFPISMQNKSPKARTTHFTLEFGLDENESDDFRSQVGSKINDTLPVRIEVGPDPKDTAFSIAKQGRGGITLTNKSAQVARFITQRICFQHIEAVRTAVSARKVVTEMVGEALDTLEANPEYLDALERIRELEQPILEGLSSSVLQTLKQFLRDIKSVEICASTMDRSRAMHRVCEINVDDGVPTLLQYKGDGVQSLAALGIIRHAIERGAEGKKNLVIAVEEPESHLHPHAIHELKEVLSLLSERHQVLVTTHNPLFVDRARIDNNIIVCDQSAKPSRTINELRECLGVRASDNLLHAEIVLLVEGEDDRISLGALLASESTKIRTAIDQGYLGIDTMGGSSNLAYKLSQHRLSMCVCHCFLDYDRAGKDAYKKALNQNLLTPSGATFCICRGCSESEIEDMFVPSVYARRLLNEFGVDITGFRLTGREKWSTKMKSCFEQHGKLWDDDTAMRVKLLVAQSVKASPGTALMPKKRNAFDALVVALERELEHRQTQQQ